MGTEKRFYALQAEEELSMKTATIVTTQDAFHVMRGHVADGTIVILPQGGKLEIVASMKGWRLVDKGRIVGESDNAYIIQDMVLSYCKN